MSKTGRRPGSSRDHEKLREAAKQFLALKYRLELFHVDANPRRIPGKKVIFARNCARGIFDDFVVIPPPPGSEHMGGLHIWLDAKTGEAGLSADQRGFRDVMKASGILALSYRTLDELDAKLQKAFAERHDIFVDVFGPMRRFPNWPDQIAMMAGLEAAAKIRNKKARAAEARRQNRKEHE